MAEMELKLEILPADLEILVDSKLFSEPAAVIEQRSTYFDAMDNRLHDAGFTLRIRQSGEERIQTVKAVGPGASLFARSEWETPVSGNTPSLDHSSPLLNEFGPVGPELVARFQVAV